MVAVTARLFIDLASLGTLFILVTWGTVDVGLVAFGLASGAYLEVRYGTDRRKDS